MPDVADFSRAGSQDSPTDRSVMPAEQFDALVAALDDPKPNLKLQQLLTGPTRIETGADVNSNTLHPR